MITLFYILAPSLLKYGKVYIAETPLFEITYKDETYFAYDEDEKIKHLDALHARGITDKQIKIQRSKGLGENDPEMMSVSTMNPLTRRLTKVEYPVDDSNVGHYFNALLGDDIETRRFMIDEYFDITENID
jgi:DNA gyrase subunit B